MEYGLDGQPVVHQGPDGWAIPKFTLDGDQTTSLDLLLNGRTVMPIPDPPRAINRSLGQRIESHAQLVHVSSWPRVTLRTVTERGALPEVRSLRVAALDPVASGPADRWWLGDRLALHLSLSSWWSPDGDTWRVRCFAQDRTRLVSVLALVRHSVRGVTVLDEE